MDVGARSRRKTARPRRRTTARPPAARRAATRWSWLLLQPLGEQSPHSLELFATQLSVRHELREHALGRAVEDRVADPRDRAASRALGADRREVAIGAPLGLVAHVALLLERLERGEHRRVSERLVERVACFGDRGRAESPEDAHDLELARRKVDVVHGPLYWFFRSIERRFRFVNCFFRRD